MDKRGVGEAREQESDIKDQSGIQIEPGRVPWIDDADATMFVLLNVAVLCRNGSLRRV